MNIKKTNLGWIAAGVLGGVLIFSGFGQSQEKFGVVDMNRMITESKLGIRNTESLRTAITSREALLSFMADNLVISDAQAARLKALSTKNPLSEAEKKEEETVKGEVMAAMKNFDLLNTKNPLTDPERAQLAEYNKNRNNTANKLIPAWRAEFQSELNTLQNEVRKAETTNAKAALDEVAKKGGYSIILELQVAPYGANDVTNDGIKALDAKTN